VFRAAKIKVIKKKKGLLEEKLMTSLNKKVEKLINKESIMEMKWPRSIAAKDFKELNQIKTL
jgi:hypothetical protein